MDPLVFVLVAGAAVLHVTWNILLKTAGDPLRAAGVGMATAAVALCPTALVAWLVVGRPAIPTETLVLSVVSGALEALYFSFLAAAYRRGDLSLVYPLARGTAPLLAVVIGVVLLQERLGPIGYVGVACLLVGLLALQRPWRYLRASGREGGGAAGFALLTGITIASYSAVDRVAVRGTEPWIYAGLIWASCTAFLWAYIAFERRRVPARAGLAVAAAGAGAGGVATSGAAFGARSAASPAFDARRAGVGGLITLAAYLLILVAFTVAPLTAVAPLRESAIVLASGWGAIRLREGADRRDVARRLGSAALVVVGAVLLAID
ncbi:MAG TPA: EamA family transporter [Candidatus Limnocylindrales bacterium]|nr:EamA family transporter [Candidatus Limnocylindrales bacterium]